MKARKPFQQSCVPGPSVAVFLGCLFFLLACGLFRAVAQEREATPAVVNPPLRSHLRAHLSLDGGWDFATDPGGAGERQGWFNPGMVWTNQLTLQVPGCWEAQGVGGAGNSVSVAPERSIRPLRGSYVGRGWYRKELTLPANWTGRQIWLKIGGVHAQGWFWVNGKFIGHNACYCGSYKYNITDLVRPGEKVSVVAEVRNDVASLKGLMGWIERFGGLYRSVELEATPDVLIDDVYAAGNFDQKSVTVQINLRQAGPPPSTKNDYGVQVEVMTLEGVRAGRASTNFVFNNANAANLAINLAASLRPFRAWSPEAPHLYAAEVVLTLNGLPIDGWVERFGVRKWEVRGGSFHLNNQKYLIRGFGDDSIYPLTLCSPASREVHRQHLQLAKSFGFNYVRHHTHCELPEYYDAADELGIMIQPELPYYGNAASSGDPAYFQPQTDLRELYTHYRRYVSLSTYCTGNEGHLGSPLDREVYQLAKGMDPTRLALHQDGGQNRKDNSDFHQGPTVPWDAGSQDGSWPFTAHEYLNLATQEDPRLAAKYAGAVLPPVTPADFRAELDQAGLSWKWGIATLDAGNQLQRVYQKLGLEQARLDPACGGYIYWTLVDVGSPAAQGLFNQFWEPKVSHAPFFSQFNGVNAVLAKFQPRERILRAGDELSVEWWISFFTAEPLRNQSLAWRLEDGTKLLKSGETPIFDAGTGEVKTIGKLVLIAPEVEKATQLQLIAELPGTRIKNSWDLWVFPRWRTETNLGSGLVASPQVFKLLKNRYPGLAEVSTPNFAAADVLLTDRLDVTARAALARGGKVLLLKLSGPTPGVALGWWAISKQAGTAVAAHPAFGDFPHHGYMDEAWFRLMGHTLSLKDQNLHKVEPLMVGRGSDGYLLHVFAASVGPGKLLASGLNLLSEQPEAVYLLDQFIRQVRSPRFHPQGTLAATNLLGWERTEPFAGELNGWSQTIRATEKVGEYESFLGPYPLCVARQTDGKSSVTWQTKAVPNPLDSSKPVTFKWLAGTGYINSAPGKFTLFLGEQPLLDLRVTHKDTIWRSPDGKTTLQYHVQSVLGEDSSGIMELTVPGALLKSGESAQLRVTGSAHNRPGWFGLYEIDF